MTENQLAAGGVVIRKKDSSLEVLLIKDSYGHWTWPKGHVEKEETLLRAALREVREETGLRSLKALGEIGLQEYWFTLGGKKIFKKVHIFLIEAHPEELLKIQLEEIQEGRWFRESEAIKMIEYEGSKKLLEKAIKTYKEKRFE